MKRSRSSLEVFDVTNGKEQKHPKTANADVLPQHEFSMLIVAPRGSGKTNFICSLVLNQYRGYFHNVLVCSPTHEKDEKWDVVRDTPGILVENDNCKEFNGVSVMARPDGAEFDGRIPPQNFFTDLGEVVPRMQEQEKKIEELYKLHGKKAKFLADRLLLIIDDQAGNFKSTAFNNPIANYCMRHRHYGSSVIFVTQSFTAMTKAVRTNCMCQILFRIDSQEELEKIMQACPGHMTPKQWMQAYEYCTNKPYGFMYMNSTLPRGANVFSNFTQRLRLKKSDAVSKLAAVQEEEDGSTGTETDEPCK